MFVGFRPEEVERLAGELEGLAWVRKLPPTNPHERLRAEAEGARFVLWKSGKMSYQGPRARELLEELAPQAGLVDAAPHTEVGSDEAGKGEWFGPLVVAAVAVRPDRRLALRLDGVRDSKQLRGDAVQRAAEAVRARAAAMNVVSIGPRRFNELWDEMHARGETLNDLLWWGHKKALEPVLAAMRGEAALRVVLDEFDATRKAGRMFGDVLPARAVVEQRPRAEDALAVAAASVVARAERDRQCAALARAWDLDVTKFTPQEARAHPQAREFAKVAYLRAV